MDIPVNAAYQTDEVPGSNRPVTVFGIRVPAESRSTFYVGVGAVVVMLLFVILLLLPSGIPFLAAKNAGGFTGYVGLFFVYMLGFFALAIAFVAILSVVGVRIQRRMNYQE